MSRTNNLAPNSELDGANGNGSSRIGTWKRSITCLFDATTKRVAVLAVAVPLAGLGGTAPSVADVQSVEGQVRSTSTTQLLEMIFFEGARLVDVRSHEEYRRGHILGALHLAAVKDQNADAKTSSRSKLEARLTDYGVTRSTHLVLYDGEDGQAARRTALWLRSHGYRRTAILNGGLRNWLKTGGTLSKRSVPVQKRVFSSTPGPFQITIAP